MKRTIPRQSKNTRFGYILILLTVLLSGCSTRQLLAPDETVARLSQGGSWKNEVDRLVNPLIESRDNIGVIVAILDEKQQVSIFPYGYKNDQDKTVITENTLFGIGSTTKSMVVSLMLALDEQGMISINDTIGELLPASFKLKDPEVNNITFAQLASHTSGLPREPFNLDSFTSLMTYFFTGDNLYGHLTEEAVYAFLQDFKIEKQPEGAPTYSNIGIGLLAHFLTLRTGQDLESLLKQYIFEPLDMQHTVIKLNSDDKARLATGYAGDQPLFIPWNTPLNNWTFSSVMLGTGGIYSTAPDLIKYLKAHLAKSKTQLDIILKQSHKILGKDRAHFLTMGWYVEQLPQYDSNLYFYHGMVAGFNCYIGFEPETEVAVVVLRNNFNWHDVVGHNLLLRLSRYAKFKKSETEKP
jgi:CubicO group peptidase (beta-lactamase class C family)